MRRAIKIVLVTAGYLGAFLAASAAVAIRIANTSGPEAQASSGMHAFGDSYLFIAVFGFLALVPTGAALHFLKSYPRFWIVLSALGLCVAFTGIVAAVLFAFGRQAVAPSPLAAWAGFSVLRILLAPVLAPAFLVVALLAPQRSARLGLRAATVLESAVVAYAVSVWFFPLLFNDN